MLTGTCRGLIPQGQVPYGKYNPIRTATKDNYRISTIDIYKAVRLESILPIVMIRNPLDWMESMCQQRFAVSWNQSASVQALNYSDSNMNSPPLPCPSLDTSIRAKIYRDFDHSNLL